MYNDHGGLHFPFILFFTNIFSINKYSIFQFCFAVLKVCNFDMLVSTP